MGKRKEAPRLTSAVGPGPRAGAEFRRHLRALGLEDADAYKLWCRAHGFRPDVHKSWPERCEEQRAAERDQRDNAARTALLQHIEALGFATEDEYAAWCSLHGFHPTAHKTPDQRRQECHARAEERARQSLERSRTRQRRPAEAILALFRGEASDLTTPYLQAIGAAFEKPLPPDVRQAFLCLLLHVDRHARLFGLEPAVAHLGPTAGNTYIEALLHLARNHRRWIRPVEDWRPASRGARRQFGSLARHLTARYDVPAFMDAVWFAGDGPEADLQRDWFLHIGTGHNIRTADLPLVLPKRAAHLFLQATDGMPVLAALRWAQVHALGGDERLARAILATRLGRSFEHEDFWRTVVHFFVNNPLLDPTWIGPFVDYIHDRKFAPVVTLDPEGNAVEGPPAHPNFCMKGRTALALQREVEDWHRKLARENRRPPMVWPGCGLEGFSREERDEESGVTARWTITEILENKALVEEGRAMGHCVASYARSCAKGNTSIWSLGVEYGDDGQRRRVMTVEVDPLHRNIVQARGKSNHLPGDKRSSPRLKQAPRFLKLWAREQGLTMPGYL